LKPVTDPTSADGSPVRFGIVGYGSGGRIFHAPLLAAADGCELVGVVTTSPDRRALLMSEHPAVAAFDDLPSLADADVEAVAISTPTDTHSTLCDEALSLGLHVVCDKPFALDATAAERTIDLAAELGLLVAPYQNRRWDSDFMTVRSVVDHGRLGEVTQLESWFERFDPERGPKKSGGGTLLDFCSHLADQALVLLGPVGTVYADWRPRKGLDDDVFVALRHVTGARSRLWASWSQGDPNLRFRVTGTEGSYSVTGMDGQEAALRRGDSPRSLGDSWGRELPERWGHIRRGSHHVLVPSLPGAWNSYYPTFAAAVRGRGSSPVAPGDAVATARVLDAARRSALTGAVIEIDSTG
jgi:predicted dehydrogenase